MTIIRIVAEIDKAKEHPTTNKHIPTVFTSPPKADLRYFNIILRFVPIKAHFTKENRPLLSPVNSLNFPIIR